MVIAPMIETQVALNNVDDIMSGILSGNGPGFIQDKNYSFF